MVGRIIKVTVVCVIILGLGISFKSVLRYGMHLCIAQDAKKDISPEQPIPQPQEPQVDSATAPMPEKTSAPEAGKYDFSDSSNWNLTVSAWESLAQKDFEGVFAYANKCLELYEAKAKELAATMRSFSRPGHEDDFAIVNDVATSHYIMGEAYMKLGRTSDALKEFQYVIDTYPLAQCWDPKGWFWKVAEVSRKNIEKIEKAGDGQGGVK